MSERWAASSRNDGRDHSGTGGRLRRNPHVVVIDIAPVRRSAALPLGRFYPIVVETDDELRELEGLFDTDQERPIAPDLLDRRPSQLVTDRILACRYAPAAEGWPWLVLFRWPQEFQEAATSNGISMARGCYTIELLQREREADLVAGAVLDQLVQRHETRIELLAGEMLTIGGRA